MMSYPRLCIKCGIISDRIWSQVCYVCLFKKLNEENIKVNKMTDQEKLQTLSYALGLLRGTCAGIIERIENKSDFVKFCIELKEVDKIVEKVLYKEG